MMKNLTFVILLLAVVSAGCKKEKALPQSIVGSWELRNLYGVQVPGAPSVFKAGNGDVIVFKDTEFQKLNDGKVTSKGTYKIITDSAEIDGTSYSKALIYNNQGIKWHFKISGRDLLISSGSIAFDGFTMKYENL